MPANVHPAWQVSIELELLSELPLERLGDITSALIRSGETTAAVPTKFDRGTGKSVGVTVVVQEADPGAALNRAHQLVKGAYSELGIAVDWLREAVVQPADRDPRV